MALVLNGGITGSASDGCAYVESKVASALPITLSCWFQSGNSAGSSSARAVIGLCDKDDASAVANYSMYARINRSSPSPGPILTAGVYLQETVSKQSIPEGRGFAINNITSGATTTITAPGHDFVSGWCVTQDTTGDFSTINNDAWAIESVSGDDVTIAYDSTGKVYSAATDFLQHPPWTPGVVWNLVVVTYAADSPTRQIFVAREGDAEFAALDDAETSDGALASSLFGAVDRLFFGAIVKSSLIGQALIGKVAHGAIWSGKRVTEAEALELLTKTPDTVTWGTPAGYWPLVSDGADAISTNDVAPEGTYVFDTDEPSLTGTAPGGGGSLPIFQYYYQGNKG